LVNILIEAYNQCNRGRKTKTDFSCYFFRLFIDSILRENKISIEERLLLLRDIFLENLLNPVNLSLICKIVRT
jgi:hypothetical protein